MTNRSLIFAAALFLPSTLAAETVFAVDSNDLLTCSNLGRIAQGFAEHKRLGMSSPEMIATMIDGGVDNEIAVAIVRTLYSFNATEIETYHSVVSALCILDRLQPTEIER